MKETYYIVWDKVKKVRFTGLDESNRTISLFKNAGVARRLIRGHDRENDFEIREITMDFSKSKKVDWL